MSKNQSRGLKLRQTHFILGKDESNYMSEYNQEYIPKKASLFEDNKSDLNLKNSHFLLGNYPTNYETSMGSQSVSIPKKITYKFDDSLNKIKLQKTNFILGNDKNEYTTKYSSEYFNKIPFLKNNNNEIEMISNKLKETHIAPPITTKINYESEAQSKFKKPLINESNQAKINTAALQKSHLSLGSNTIPWISTNRYFLTPKNISTTDNKRYNYDTKIRESNIVFSQEKEHPNFRTENMDSYGEIPLTFEQNKLDINLKNNLRKEHFSFGNEDHPNNRISLNQINYRNPNLYNNYRPMNLKNILDINKLRKSNWTISNGDERNFFKSSYELAMTPKKPEIKEKKEINTFKSSVIIGRECQQGQYISEYKKNFLDGKLGINLKSFSQDKKLLETINNIRKSHFKLGDSKNDYLTISHDAYKYNPVLAKEGRGKLNDKLKNNLINSHYELGLGNEREKYSSNRRDYISYPNFKVNKKIEKNKESSVFHRDRNIFEGESIYMSDYIEKKIPEPDDNLPNFI